MPHYDTQQDLPVIDAATNPVFCPNRPIKVLFSPGHGSGWVTYAPRNATDAFLVWMLTYEPLIEGLDRHVKIGQSRLASLPPQRKWHTDSARTERLEELMTAFHHEAHVRFGYDRLITARVTDLFVVEVAGAFEVRETEGQERLVDVTRRREIFMAVHMSVGDREREAREREAREMGEARERGQVSNSSSSSSVRGMKA